MEKTKKKHTALLVVVIVMVSIIIFYGVIALLPRPKNYEFDNVMRKSGEYPILLAHGGGHFEFPDNSFEACYNAYTVDQNVMFEMDCSITKDGVVILSHDTTLDRKTNLTGPISEHNYTDLISNKVNFGYTNDITDGDVTHEDDSGNFVRSEDATLVPFRNINGEQVTPADVLNPLQLLEYRRDSQVFLATSLEDLLKFFPNNRINIEIKQSGELGKSCLNAVIELIEKYEAYDRVVLASFHDEIYKEFQKLQANKSVPDNFMYSPSTKPVTSFVILQMLNLDVFFGDKMCVFQLPMAQSGVKLATKGLVSRAHAHNLAVHYWKIDNEEDMRYLVDIGADGIMTNLPHLLKSVYDSYK